MNTIQEIHIDFGIKTQKINAKVFGNFREHEIDWLIDDTILTYIDNNVSPKRELRGEVIFETIKGLYNNLEELVTVKELDLYKHPTLKNKMITALPKNFFKIIDDATASIPNCKDINSLNKEDAGLYYFAIELKKDETDPTQKFYKGFQFKVEYANTNTEIVYSVTSSYPEGVDSEDYRYMIIRDILNLSPNVNFDVRWEKYGNVYIPNNIIVVSKFAVTLYYTFNSYDGVGTTWGLIDRVPIEGLKNYILTDAVTDYYSNRLVKNEFTTSYINNSILKPNIKSPISTLEGGNLIVHHSNNFIPKKVLLTYIRKPKYCNYFLNIKPDINPNVLGKIVNLAVERVALISNRQDARNIIELNKNLS